MMSKALIWYLFIDGELIRESEDRKLLEKEARERGGRWVVTCRLDQAFHPQFPGKN